MEERASGVKTMKIRHLLAGSAALFVVASASAQVAIGPFLPAAMEKFEPIAPGAYVGFAGFAGLAGFSRIGGAGLLIVNNNPAVLTGASPPHTMFGRGANVRVRMQSVRKKFGGVFRVPNAGVAVTTMFVRFRRAGVFISPWIAAPVNAAVWQWRGWDVGPIGGYDEVYIYGNGSTPGYVGMDNMRIF